MGERYEGPQSSGDVMQLKGLIYVRALRAAGGASDEELARFSAAIRRERRQLEAEVDPIGHGVRAIERSPPGLATAGNPLESDARRRLSRPRGPFQSHRVGTA